jgi:tetratricopeptide (TPR) repeat protein
MKADEARPVVGVRAEQDALSQLRQALGLRPSAPEPDAVALLESYEQACEHLARGRIDQAAVQFEALVQAAPLEQRFHFGLGLCLQDAGQIADAMRHYGVAYVLDASDAACAFRMGECLAAAGLVDDAREAFEAAKALSSLPSNASEVGQMAQAALAKL